MRKTKIATSLLSAFLLSACTLGFKGNDGGMMRSDDGGRTFERKNAISAKNSIDSVDVLSIAVHPQNGNELYIGTKNSGIFKTENAGEEWSQLKVAEITPTKVYSLALNPHNSKEIYATAVLGNRGKILKSDDGGEMWKEVYTEPADGSSVLSLGVNPHAPRNIYAGTEKGQVIFSEDGGETWRNVLWTKSRGAIYKIAIDNADPNTAYFLLHEKGVLRTTDGGKNFEELKREGDETLFGGKDISGAVSILADPSREGWVYLGVSEGLIRSKNKGESWEVVKTLNKPNELNIRAIAVNPQNSEEILCSVAQAFYKSNDGGVNWLPVQVKTKRTLEVVAYNGQNPSQIFAGLNSR